MNQMILIFNCITCDGKKGDDLLRGFQDSKLSYEFFSATRQMNMLVISPQIYSKEALTSLALFK